MFNYLFQKAAEPDSLIFNKRSLAVMNYHLSPNDEFLTSSMSSKPREGPGGAGSSMYGQWLQYRLKVSGCSTVQFKVVSMLSEQPIYMCSVLPLIGFPNTDLETIPMFV